MILSRGIRNNNPGNIRHGDKWLGMSADQPDPDFISFTDPVYGLRAIAKILLAYQNKDGLHTVLDMITRWAPPSENNTAAYVEAVAAQMQVAASQVISLTPDVLGDFVAAIVQHENGQQPYPPSSFYRAVQMALQQESP